MQRKVVAICSILTLIGFGTWAYFEPSFEPFIGVIVSIGGLASSYWPQKRNSNVPSQYSRGFDALKARWEAEKSLDIPNPDEAKYITSLMIDFLKGLRVSDEAVDFYSEIDSFTRELKSLQSITIYLDNSGSEEFWSGGSQTIDNIHEFIRNKI